MASETTEQLNTATQGVAKPLPIAMEIPVTVNGASTVAGSEKRQPFSETTQTVLVFGSGAVIRLATAVGPGQLLFVTNEKSKQEVVCQVVKTKQNGSSGGYVELKFTEATVDFWGIRAPGNRAGNAASGIASTTGSSTGAPTRSLELKLADLKTSTTATQAPVQIARPVAPSVTRAAEIVAASESPATPVVPAQPPRVPTLSEFLTQGSNGLELKAREKSPAEKSQNGDSSVGVVPSNEKPRIANSAAPEVSLDQDHKLSLSTALGVTHGPAPGAASFDLSADLPAEEVKIPAWLEPLARNSAATESKHREPKPVEKSADPISLVEEQNLSRTLETVQPQQEPISALSIEGRTPNFGTSLPLDSQTASSGKGWKIGLVVAAVLLAAAAIWYWYVNQPPKVSAGGNATAAGTNPESIPAPSSSSAISEPVPSTTLNAAASRIAEPAPALQPIASSLNGARPSGNVPSSSAVASDNSSVNATSEVTTVEPAKKPALGQVHLAAPKVKRNSDAQGNAATEPGLALSGAAAVDSSSVSMLTGKSKGPAAPLPIGGDVKPAKLLSSVPPAYPQIARTQRISGDVTIDAQIDVNGRVATTHVLSGPTLLHEAAMGAVRQWKYQPATLNGVPTATHLTVTVQFRLQ